MSTHSDLRNTLRMLASGRPVDWTTVDGRDAGTSTVLDGLKLISKIAEVHADEGRDVTVDVNPTRWGSFVLLERVGQGAYGTVYRAFDQRLGREVALKLSPPLPETQTHTLFVREAGLLARVQHPNVVTVYGADHHDGRLGIWMMYVRGRTVDELVRGQGAVDPSRVAAIGLQIARGVQAVHDAGVVHRDINARNVIIQEGGRAVVMDFGAGISRDDASSGTSGTPLFIAPEVLAGGAATPVSDVYSIGVLLYFMATGGFPVGGETVSELQAAHHAGMRLSVGQRLANVPTWLEQAIERASDPAPDRRFRSAAALEAALVASQPGTHWPRVFTAIVVVLIAAVAALLTPVSRPTQSQTATSAGPTTSDPLESVAVHSSAAARDYKESLRLGRRGEWSAAIGPATKAVQEDPGFASGWIWLAWTVRNAELGGLPYYRIDAIRQEADRRSAPYVARAVALAPTVPEWERHWILGTAALFAADDAGAVSHMGAVLGATGLDYALNNLINTTTRIYLRARTPEEASALVAHARRVIPANTWDQCCEWAAWAPAYVAWRTNRIEYVNARIDEAIQALKAGARAATPPPYFALSVGRLADAAALMMALSEARPSRFTVFPLLAVAEARGDEGEIGRLAATIPRRGDMMRPSRLLRAGFVHDVEEMLSAPIPATPYAQALFDVARGQLLARQDKFTDAVPLLRNGRYALINTAFSEYYDACATLAEGFVQQHAITTAIDELKQCTDRELSYGPDGAQNWTSVWRWLTLQQDLADLYRSVGRSTDADAIGSSLKTKLAAGDRDVPLVRRVLDAPIAGAH